MVAVLVASDTRTAFALDDSLRTFFGQYCSDCHADGAAEGGLELDKLSSDLDTDATFASWVRIYDRVQSGEMPPEDDET